MKKALQLIDDRPVFAGIIGPFSLAGRLVDGTKGLVEEQLKAMLDEGKYTAADGM